MPHVSDQFAWSGELHRLGAAPKMLRRTAWSAKKLASRITEVLGNPRMKEAAMAMSARMQNDNGPETAADLIEQTCAWATRTARKELIEPTGEVRMVTRSGQRSALVIVFLAGFITFNAASASAQSSINFTGGGSIDPEQVYAGVSWSSPDLGGRFKIRPGIDGGFGDGLRLANINIDLIVKFPLGTTGWS